MEVFLLEQKKKLVNAKGTVKVVLGNESCDLDSVISAIVFAYFLYEANKSTDIVIPVLNVRREDVYLRTEVVFFLKKTNIPVEELVCIDEINLQALQDEKRLCLILVDHNALSDDQSNLQDSVIQIVDHHKVSNPEQISRYKSKIENVGSCSTLIAEEVLKSVHLMNQQIALLLYGTILLDTVCLQESAKRVTEKDKDIAAELEKFLSGINREDLFNELQKAKFTVSNLTPEQLLRKDTKYISCESTAVAIASLPMLLEEVVQQEEFLSALSQMVLKKKLDFIIILGSQIVEEKALIKRQLAIFDNCQKSLEKISNYLQNLENPSLDLHPLPVNHKCVLLFDQENAALSRKFVLPIMQQYLKELH